MMVEVALPMLVEDGSRLDWPEAAYLPDVRFRNGFARVTHRIHSAPELESLINEGSACWAVELRCPKTLLARIETSATHEMEVRWNATEVDGIVYLIPGMLATDNVHLRTENLNELWTGFGPVLDVPVGWWLARGNVYRASTLREALISFDEDPDLPDGGMKITPDRSSGRIHFIVYVASDIRDAVEHDRSMQVAGLIGVCALFPKVFTGEDAKLEHISLINEIGALLDGANVPDWEAGDSYDPVRAATVIERFIPLKTLKQEMDDE